MDLYNYWRSTIAQDASSMKTFFHEDAFINWHNTNEQFTVDEYIQANCDYPGEWDGAIERIETAGSLIITVTHVYATDKPLSFHVTSFLQVKDKKILSVDEYWSEDGPAPKWRLDKRLGKPIKEGQIK